MGALKSVVRTEKDRGVWAVDGGAGVGVGAAYVA